MTEREVIGERREPSEVEQAAREVASALDIAAASAAPEIEGVARLMRGWRDRLRAALDSYSEREQTAARIGAELALEQGPLLNLYDIEPRSDSEAVASGSCPDCRGRGKLAQDGPECSTCNGTGETPGPTGAGGAERLHCPNCGDRRIRCDRCGHYCRPSDFAPVLRDEGLTREPSEEAVKAALGAIGYGQNYPPPEKIRVALAAAYAVDHTEDQRGTD